MCSNFSSIESTLAKKIIAAIIFLYFGIFILFITYFFSHVTSFSIPKKLLHIVGNKMRKESWQLVEKQKSYSKSKNSKFLV